MNNNNMTQTFSQGIIIQKWTFKTQEQTNNNKNPRNKNTNSTNTTPKIEIQHSLIYELKHKQMKHNYNYLNNNI